MSDHQRSFASPLKWAFLMNWGDRAMSTVFTIVLAAILGPRDFGVVALALIYIALIQLVLEGGVQTALVQREDLDDAHLSSAFWLNLAMCVVLALVSFALAPWWASLNDVPELADVVRALSLILLFYGFTIVQLALFQRAMNFKGLAIRENAAVLVGGVLGIVLAVRGAGVWALVAQQLGFAATQLVLLWAQSSWRPSFTFSRAHARELVGFSSGVFLSNLGGFLNRRADALLMGIFFGPVAVGLYRLADRFAENVLELTMRPVGHVSLPLFSRLQRDRPALRDAVATSMRLTLVFTVPALAVLAACSDFLMGIMGDEWEPAADVLKILALVSIGKALVFFTGPLLFAVGRPHFRAIMLWALAAVSAGTVLLVGSLLEDEASREQALGMAASRAAYFLAIVIPVNVAVVWWVTGLRPRSFLPWLPAPLLSGAAAIAAVAALELAGVLGRLPDAAALAVAGAIGFSAAGAVLLSLEPEARRLALPVYRKLLRRETDTATV